MEKIINPAAPFYKAAVGKVAFVEVPEMAFLMMDGQGDPNTSPRFAECVQALYAVSYTLKFALKKRAEIDYKVGALEGLWWMENMAEFSAENKDRWLYTVMIAQPDAVTAEAVAEAIAEVRKKKGIAALDDLRFERFREGRCAQTLYIGPFADEGPTIAWLHEAIAGEGGTRAGKHHEIYLSDFRRVPPERWRTLIRQPMAGKA